LYYTQIHLKTLIVVLCGSFALASGCGGQSSSNGQVNNFSNGFRLVSVTVDNLLFDTLDYSSTLEYNAESSSAMITRTSFDDGVEEVSVRTLEMDSLGRPEAIVSMDDSEQRRREYNYDSQGRLSTNSSSTGIQTYQYSDGLLQSISYSRRDRFVVDVQLEYNYDDAARLISTVNRFEGESTTYEYNDLNQIVTASETVTADQRPLFSHSFEYNDDGNMIRETITRQFGDIYQINEYDYEATMASTFNYGAMRMAIAPFNAIVFGLFLF